jgi:predicted homoserine dehydrogenase-like protein
METPLSVAEAVLYREPTIAPRGAPVAEVVALAKRDLKAGEVLDGIGGFSVYGQVDTVERAREFLPVGLADNARLTRPVAAGEPVPLSSVEFSPGDYIVNLRHLQDTLFSSFEPTLRNVETSLH